MQKKKQLNCGIGEHDMKEYLVTVTQYHEYYVDAEDEDEAQKLGIKEFKADMRRAVADIHYDEVDVELLEEEDDE